MIITIDTAKDSHEDIRRAIDLLQNLTGSAVVTNQPQDVPTPSEGMFNMFGSQENSEEKSEEPENRETDKKPDIPEIVPY